MFCTVLYCTVPAPGLLVLEGDPIAHHGVQRVGLGDGGQRGGGRPRVDIIDITV